MPAEVGVPPPTRVLRCAAGRALAALAVCVTIAGGGGAPRQGIAQPAPPDTAAARPAPPDTAAARPAAPDTAAARPAPPDTTAAAPRDTTGAVRGVPSAARQPVAARVVADFEEARKRGDVSWARAIREIRPALVRPLPLFGAGVGSVSVPDAGSPLRPSPRGAEALFASDRALLTAMEYGVGIHDLAAALDAPRAEGVEMLELTSLRPDAAPSGFQRAGDLASRPPTDAAFARVMPGAPGRLRRARSALYYGNGESGELETGARFLGPALLKGVAGSFAHHAADGVAPLHHSESTRYALAAGLPRVLGHDLWIEGSVLDWDLEDLALDPATSGFTSVLGRAEIRRRELDLHGRAAGERWETRWTARAERVKRTTVAPAFGRERWELPGAAFDADAQLALTGSWTGLAGARLASRSISFREDSAPLFEDRRGEARVGLGLRKALGRGAGIQAEAVGDAREMEAWLVDGRLSAWAAGSRASARLDLERAHERPTWVDLRTPERVLTAFRLPDGGKVLRLARAGGAGLSPRRLTGALARASYALHQSLTIEAEGAARRLEDDFGWDVTRVDTPDTLFVDARARRRGSGWVSYGGLGIDFRSGAVALRLAGWARGGPDELAPRAGSPARYGATGALDLRVVLFRGDLPLQAGVIAQGEGSREGTVTEPGWFRLDAALRADFGAMGAFAEMMNVLDRRIPSAVEDVVSGRAMPLPGQSLHLGVVWYLFD